MKCDFVIPVGQENEFVFNNKKIKPETKIIRLVPGLNKLVFIV
jgi:hypothetical protein